MKHRFHYEANKVNIFFLPSLTYVNLVFDFTVTHAP